MIRGGMCFMRHNDEPKKKRNVPLQDRVETSSNRRRQSRNRHFEQPGCHPVSAAPTRQPRRDRTFSPLPCHPSSTHQARWYRYYRRADHPRSGHKAHGNVDEVVVIWIEVGGEESELVTEGGQGSDYRWEYQCQSGGGHCYKS